jgi:hypothetical protein
MSQQRYMPEFKDEAVRQVTENALWFQSVAVATPALQNVMRRSGELPMRGDAHDRVLGPSQQAGGLGGLGVETPFAARRLSRGDRRGCSLDLRAVPVARPLNHHLGLHVHVITHRLLNRLVSRSRRSAAVVSLALLAAAVGCAGRGVSGLAPIYGYGETRKAPPGPIVMTSGFLGSALEDRDTGRVVWGEFFTGEQSMHKPEIRRRMALPLVGGDSLGELRDSVEPTKALQTVRLGWRRGELTAYPGVMVGIALGAEDPDDEDEKPSRRTLRRRARVDTDGSEGFYGVAYDWRRDVSEATTALDQALRRAHADKRARGLRGDGARVDLMAHSLGCLLTRYYLRYGTQPLPEDGSLPVLDWRGAELVRRAILIGPPNGGSLEAVISIGYGAHAIPILPKYPAAIIGTFHSIYQLMPHAADGSLVYADDGRPVNLYEVDTWEANGWGLFADNGEVLADLLPDAMTPEQRREAARRYLGRMLARAEQLHRALDVPSSPPDGLTFHLFAGDTLPTPARAEIDRATGKFTALRTEPGDGVVTRRSALHDTRADPNPHERIITPIDWTSVHFGERDHFNMTGTRSLANDVLYLLLQAPN